MNKHALVTFTTLLVICSAQAQIAPSIEWEHAQGGSLKDAAQDVRQTADGGYVVAAWAESEDGDVVANHGSTEMWLIKFDGMGNISWRKALGGISGDGGQAIQQTTDGGYVVAGGCGSNDGDVSGNHGSSDVWVVKLDDMGNITWQKALGGTSYDVARGIEQTAEGGYIVAGETLSNNGDMTGNHGGYDAWVVKLDGMGNITWQKTLGGTNYDGAYAVRPTTDGGYVIAGDTFSNNGDVTGNHGDHDAWVVKLDAVGNITWQRALGGSDADNAHAVEQTTDDGYVVAGSASSTNGDVTGNHGVYDAWVVKLTAVGNITWQRALGGSASDHAQAIQQTTDGGYVVAGSAGTNSGDVTGNHGGSDVWVVKLDDMGNITWQKAMGGTSDEEANAVRRTADGGYVVAGRTNSGDGEVTGYHDNMDAWVVKLATHAGKNGVEEPVMGSFHVGPNPSPGLIRIRSALPLQNAQLTLTDALGREVLRENMRGTSTTLDLTSWPRGLYLLAIRSEEGTSSQRLVLE
ncbi:MAG TPA: T9SS type A sorting domain-containing protein [Flavobacteriales bacterium]|nr:T9SS type A sorting domain-containing protein [Flavobacteriales bacterium]